MHKHIVRNCAIHIKHIPIWAPIYLHNIMNDETLEVGAWILFVFCVQIYCIRKPDFGDLILGETKPARVWRCRRRLFSTHISSVRCIRDDMMH